MRKEKHPPEVADRRRHQRAAPAQDRPFSTEDGTPRLVPFNGSASSGELLARFLARCAFLEAPCVRR